MHTKKGILYKSYRFRMRDPVMGRILSIMDDSGMSNAEIHRQSGVSPTTMGNWKMKTMRPQFCTIEAVARACGKTLVFADKH